MKFGPSPKRVKVRDKLVRQGLSHDRLRAIAANDLPGLMDMCLNVLYPPTNHLWEALDLAVRGPR